jgi:2-haloalkanoic acid dehalogenase type II
VRLSRWRTGCSSAPPVRSACRARSTTSARNCDCSSRSYVPYSSVADLAHEHELLLGTLRAGDAQRATVAWDEHFQNAERFFLDLIQESSMRFAGFEALSFDCYGTLIDWETGIVAVLRPWADAHRLPMTDEQLLTAYSTHEAQAEAEHPRDLYPQLLARAMRALGTQFGVPVSDAEAESLAVSVPDWPAFADSAQALERLSRRYKLIILSNVDRASFAHSNRRLGVTFTSILTAQDIGSYKPSPRNFEALAREVERLGVAQGGLLHVAQSLFHDHVPAKAAGLPTVWINRRHDKPGWGATPQPSAEVRPDWVFTSIAAFADAVDAESH